MRTRAIVVAALAASFAACSLTTDLGGLSGGVADQPEGGTVEGGEGPPIANDGGAGDGDARAGEGGPVDPCAGAVFCDQFERDAPQGKWQSAYTDNGGTLSIDPTTSTSPSRSLSLFVPAAGTPHADLSSPDFPSVAHARVSWSMKSGAPNRSLSLMRIQLSANGRTAVIDTFMFDGRFVLDENVFGTPTAGYADYNLEGGGFKVDTWQRWTMELDATGTTAVAIVTLDGVERLRTNLKNTYGTGTLNIVAGAFYAPDGVALTLNYDDVNVTILP